MLVCDRQLQTIKAMEKKIALLQKQLEFSNLSTEGLNQEIAKLNARILQLQTEKQAIEHSKGMLATQFEMTNKITQLDGAFGVREQQLVQQKAQYQELASSLQERVDFLEGSALASTVAELHQKTLDLDALTIKESNMRGIIEANQTTISQLTTSLEESTAKLDKALVELKSVEFKRLSADHNNKSLYVVVSSLQEKWSQTTSLKSSYRTLLVRMGIKSFVNRFRTGAYVRRLLVRLLRLAHLLRTYLESDSGKMNSSYDSEADVRNTKTRIKAVEKSSTRLFFRHASQIDLEIEHISCDIAELHRKMCHYQITSQGFFQQNIKLADESTDMRAALARQRSEQAKDISKDASQAFTSNLPTNIQKPDFRGRQKKKPVSKLSHPPAQSHPRYKFHQPDNLNDGLPEETSTLGVDPDVTHTAETRTLRPRNVTTFVPSSNHNDFKTNLSTSFAIYLPNVTTNRSVSNTFPSGLRTARSATLYSNSFSKIAPHPPPLPPPVRLAGYPAVGVGAHA
jgi:hypothetical protein